MGAAKKSTYFNDSAVARYVTKILNSSQYSQAEIARRMGMERSNVITMIKQGTIRMPMDRVLAFARATETDPAFLLDLLLEECHPEIRQALAEIKSISLSHDEAKIIKTLREAKADREKEEGELLTWKTDRKSLEKLARLARSIVAADPVQNVT